MRGPASVRRRERNRPSGKRPTKNFSTAGNTRPPSASWSPCTRSTARSSSRFRWPRWGGICCWERAPASTMYVRGCVAGLRQQAPMHVAFNLEDSTVVLVRRNDALAAEGRFGARRDGRRRGRLRQHRGAIPDQGLQRRPDGRGDRRHGALLHGHSGTLPDRRRIRSVRYFGRDEDRPDPRDRCPELERRTLCLHFDAVQRERMAVHLSCGRQSARGCGCRLLARSHARGKHAAPAGRRPHRPVHDRKEGALRGGRACRRGEVRRTLEHRSAGYGRPTCAASSRTRCARSRCTWTRICPRRGASR